MWGTWLGLPINNQTVMNRSMDAAPNALFKSLADPTRRALFERLCREGEQTVRVLTSHAGVSQPAVSKHLGILKRAGLVRDRRQGRETHYSAEPQALAPLIDWMSLYGAFWRERFDRLEALLNRMDQ
jgi:DNA-binding transcriptional ArsR family regulator